MQRADTMTVYAETVLERVLLAIIEAHPGDGARGPSQERLEMALKALLGTSPACSAAFNEALVFMVRQRQHDACNADMSALTVGSGIHSAAVRSMRDLAENAACNVLGLVCPAEVHEAAVLLCREYRRRAEQQAVEGDPAREAMQDEAVRRILDELIEWHVL